MTIINKMRENRKRQPLEDFNDKDIVIVEQNRGMC